MTTDDGMEWKVYFIRLDPVAISSPHPAARRYTDLAAWCTALDQQDGQPFLIGPQGPDARINLFFYSHGVRATQQETQQLHAYNLAIWCGFLQRRRTTWVQATAEDVEAWHQWCLRDATNTARVSPGRFNHMLSTVRLFYDWAVGQGFVAHSPVALRRYRGQREWEARRADGVPAAQATNSRAMHVKWYTPAALDAWRDVGLRGYSLEGLPDNGFRGRLGGRDVAFFELLRGTALRLEEAATLCVAELPDLRAPRRFARCLLGGGVAKGGRTRAFWLPAGAWRDLDTYRLSVRAEAVRRAQRAGRYERLPHRVMFETIDGRGRWCFRQPDGTRLTVPLASLDEAVRLRAYRHTDEGLEPLMLWLNEDGTPRPHHRWEFTFRQANTRARRAGLAVWVTPHILRHSRALVLYVAAKRLRALVDAGRVEAVRLVDEWDLVRTYLGHTSVDTTREIYLEPVQDLGTSILLELLDATDVDSLLDVLALTHPRVGGVTRTGAASAPPPPAEGPA